MVTRRNSNIMVKSDQDSILGNDDHSKDDREALAQALHSFQNNDHSKDDRTAAEALLQLWNGEQSTHTDHQAAATDQQPTTTDDKREEFRVTCMQFLGNKYLDSEPPANANEARETALGHAVEDPDQADFHQSQASIFRHACLNMPPSSPVALNNIAHRSHCGPAEMRNIVRSRACSIMASWVGLREIVHCHEARIRRKWTKLTRAKRRNFLVENISNLPEHHRPDMNPETGLEPWMPHRTEYFRSFLWPMVNLEDLSKPKNFLLFLNARARHPPYVFTEADLNSARHPPKAKFGP